MPGLLAAYRDALRAAGGPALRRLVLAVGVWVVLTGVLVGVGELVKRSGVINTFDHRVTARVVAGRSPTLNAFMKACTWLGSWVAVVVTGTLLVVTALRQRRWLLALPLAVLVWAGEQAGVTLTKHLVTRPRPPRELWLVTAHGWSWPSGHTATAAVVFGVLALLATVGRGRRWRQVAVWALAVAGVALTGFSRVELGVHWTTDVLAGAIFAAAWVAGSALLLWRFAEAGPPEGPPRSHRVPAGPCAPDRE